MSKGKLVAVCFVWLMLMAIGAVAWKVIFAPARHTAEQQQEQQQAEQLEKTRRDKLQNAGAPSRYRHQINLHLDSFSGYAVIRSDTFSQELAQRGIRLNLHDDGADYPARIRELQSGEAQFAVFTIDALITTSADLGELPATIIALVDETTGADAIVAYKSQIPNVDGLNSADTRFVLTPNSPSETLARVVMSRFQLNHLADNPFIEARDAGDVFERYKQAKPTEKFAYVLWQPYVSQVLKNPLTHVVIDSSHFPSTIVDVIVANRDFVLKNPDVVKDVVESYLTSVYQYRDRSDMVQLVTQDAKATGSPLTAEEASKLVDGIWWKNTQENLAHTGHLVGKPLPHIEDVIANITDVLQSTGAITSDPTAGKPNYLYYAKVFEELQDFHPGTDREDVRSIMLPALNDQQWEELTEVGTARVPSLIFARGTDRLTERSRSVLDELVGKLTTTRFYVSIRGNASTVGDLEQNKLLAERRARAAQEYLVEKGVDSSRIRALGGQPSGTTSVTFMLGQLPY
ncbi:MAG: phosphate ABC transporter substrate-binding/OmpA family protein [Planctomycetota bacterium]|nr:phosphate ABC transporter substrate-binding/OmpA family protein [Planctomycetota bacterium]